MPIWARRSAPAASGPIFYYRLAVFTLGVPALRQRREDIGLLARHFLQVYALEMRIPSPAISPEAVTVLEQHDFPGNVRELKSIIERALIESRHGQIHPEHLHLPVVAETQPGVPPLPEPESLPLELERALADTEIALIRRALAQTGDNVAAAARLLSTHRSRIYRALGRPADPV